jgi:hypothetical protein
MPVRLPGAEALGGRPTPQSQRGVSGYEPGNVGRAIAGVGAVVGQIGEEHEREQDAQAVFAARRKLDDWERAAIYDPKNGAIARRGKDAFDLPDRLPSEFDKAAGEIGASLTSKRQRQAFQQMAQSRRESVGAWATRHAGQQKEAHDLGQYQADVQSFQDRAATFPDKAPVEAELMKTRTIGFLRSRGASEEEIGATIKKQASEIHTAAVGSMLNAGNGEAAQAYLERHKPDMTADAVLRVEGALKETVARAKAQTFGDEVDAKGLTLDQALTAARKKFTGKDEDAAIQEIKTRFNEREVLKSRAEKDNSDAAWKVISAGGGRKSIPSTVWNALDGKEQAQINDYIESKWRRAKADAEGKDVKTNMKVYAGLLGMTPEEFTTADLLRYQGDLSRDDMRTMLNRQERLREPKEATDVVTLDQQVSATINTLGLSGDKDQEKKGALQRSIHLALESELRANGGKKLTQAQRQSIIDKQIIEVTVPDTFLYFDSKKPAFLLTPEERAKVDKAKPKTAGKAVVRTGTLNGRKVVQYSDGSTAYAD